MARPAGARTGAEEVVSMKHTKAIRRALCLVMIAALLVLTAAPALAASSKNPHGAYVVATNSRSRLRVRSAANGAVKAYLKRGTIVVYRYTRKGWWYVDYAGGSGFVDRRYLWSVDNSTSKAKYASWDNLWVHYRPDVDSWCYGKLKAGKQVTIEKQSGNWVLINYKGHTGWVYSKYLKRVK